MQGDELVQQLGFGFHMIRVPNDAVNRANADTGLMVVKTDTLGAEIGINLVHLGAHGDGLVRTLRLTHVTVDALGRNQQRHA